MSVTTQFLTDEIFPDKAETLTVKLYEDGGAVATTTALYEIYDSAGTLIKSGTATPSAESGGTVQNVLKATTGATDFTDDEMNCHIEWSFTILSQPYVFINLFDVVNYKINNTVKDADLLTFYPNLANELTKEQSNFDAQIQRAFIEVKLALKEKGAIPRRILDSEQIKHLIIYKAFEIILFAFPRTSDSIWELKYQEMKKKYEEELKKVYLKYDDDESGVVDSVVGFATIRLQR
jgi:hypothetical protein